MPHLFYNVEFQFSWFCNTKQSSEISVLKTEMLLDFQNKTNIDIAGFSLIYFRFALDLSDIGLWNIDLINLFRYRFVIFACIHNVLKTSSRGLQDMPSRRYEDDFRVIIFCLPRRLGRRKIFTLKTCWRRLQDVLKTNKCLLGRVSASKIDFKLEGPCNTERYYWPPWLCD